MPNKFVCKLSGGPWDGYLFDVDATVQPDTLVMIPTDVIGNRLEELPPWKRHHYKLNEYSGEYDHIPPGEF